MPWQGGCRWARSSKPTLSDVAARAGVSATTASYILNGRTLEMRISSDTEQRVRRAATELAYRPNRSARNLRTASTATIGMISDLIAGGHVASHLLTGANEAAQELDHLVVIGESGGRPRPRVPAHRGDDRPPGRRHHLRHAGGARRHRARDLFGQRVVLLNCIDPQTDLPSVMPDDVMGGRVAAQALLDAGVADGIYVVGEDPDDTVVAGPDAARRRPAGAAGRGPRAGRRRGVRVGGARGVRRRLGAGSAGPPPRGLICLNDRVAMGVYQALAERGLACPTTSPSSPSTAPSWPTGCGRRLVSVALPFAAMGRQAVRILLDPTYDGPRQVRLPMRLEPGGSLPRSCPRGLTPA